MKAYVPLQVIQRLSVNWQSEKKNINLTGHLSYVFSTEWKGHIQKCMQPYQGRTSPACQSHIALSGRNDTDEKRRARELNQAIATGLVLPLSLSGSRCSFKTIGGLSHSQKWSEAQRFSWLLSKPTCAEYNQPSETERRNAPQSVSSLLTSIPLTILDLLLHVYD